MFGKNYLAELFVAFQLFLAAIITIAIISYTNAGAVYYVFVLIWIAGGIFSLYGAMRAYDNAKKDKDNNNQ